MWHSRAESWSILPHSTHACSCCSQWAQLKDGPPSTISPPPSCPCHLPGCPGPRAQSACTVLPRVGEQPCLSPQPPWVPVPLLPNPNPKPPLAFVSLQPGARPGHQGPRLCTLPNPFISSWKAPLTVSELNQQEEGRAQAELAPGTLLFQARAPGVQPCHRLGPSA